MKRILLVLSVAALMALSLAMAPPAFAEPPGSGGCGSDVPGGGCGGGGRGGNLEKHPEKAGIGGFGGHTECGITEPAQGAGSGLGVGGGGGSPFGCSI